MDSPPIVAHNFLPKYFYGDIVLTNGGVIKHKKMLHVQLKGHMGQVRLFAYMHEVRRKRGT